MNALRVISVHLTSFAPGCDRRSVGDAHRWRSIIEREPRDAVRRLVALAGVPARELGVETQINGDLALMGQPRPLTDGRVPDLTDEDGRAPLAFVWDGLTEPELRAELQALAKETL